MNKADLIKAISKEAGLTQKESTRAIDEITRIIMRCLKKGEEVRLQNFGSFNVVKRKARLGRNPRTGEEIKIKATKAVKFNPSQLMKDKVKKGR